MCPPLARVRVFVLRSSFCVSTWTASSALAIVHKLHFACLTTGAMALKRKRSDSRSSPFSASSMHSPSRLQSSSPPWDDRLHQPYHEGSDSHSRTMKRHRDNRPDEGTVHSRIDADTCAMDVTVLTLIIGYTYHRLFAAARSPPPPLQQLPINPTVHSRPEPSGRQSSLHTFWSIRSAEPAMVIDTPAAPAPTLSCQDCDGDFLATDPDISMGGVDEVGEKNEWACRQCRRIVCGNCAVVETGLGRECLQCRTSVRKKWIGGIGWMV